MTFASFFPTEVFFFRCFFSNFPTNSPYPWPVIEYMLPHHSSTLINAQISLRTPQMSSSGSNTILTMNYPGVNFLLTLLRFSSLYHSQCQYRFALTFPDRRLARRFFSYCSSLFDTFSRLHFLSQFFSLSLLHFLSQFFSLSLLHLELLPYIGCGPLINQQSFTRFTKRMKHHIDAREMDVRQLLVECGAE